MKSSVMLWPSAHMRKSGRSAIESVDPGTADMMVGPHTCLYINISLIASLPGTCKQCQRGFNQACVNGQINGVTRDGGCTSCRITRLFGLLI